MRCIPFHLVNFKHLSITLKNKSYGLQPNTTDFRQGSGKPACL